MKMEPPPLNALLESEWSRTQKRRRRSGRTFLAASVVAHADQAGEFESHGYPATNAFRHNGVCSGDA